MARIEGEVLIRRPVEDVFDFVADERTEPIFNHQMLRSEKVTDGPIGAGTRFRAIIRAGGKALPMDVEYTRFDRPHLIASTTHMSTADFSGTLTFTPTPSGTRLRWSWQTQPKGVLRLAGPVLSRLGARQERQMWTQLRDHLEAASHARTDAGPHHRAGDVPGTRKPADTGDGSSAGTFIKRHAVPVFYVLVVAFVLGLSLVVSAFLGATDSADTGAESAGAADLTPAMYVVAVLAGPGSYALAAVLVTALAFGRAGLRDLGSRLIRWRVGVRWYVVALLTAPVLMTTTLLVLSLASDSYIPAIVTAEDKVSLLVAGLGAGLMAGFFEEIAWTGFATHELSRRHRVLVTGLLVALPWFALHLPLLVPADTGTVPQAFAVAASVPWFVAYRVLMVWVYAHTQSVLLAVLMHLPITASAFILASPAMMGVPDLIYNLVLGAEMWILVAVIAAGDHRTPARSGLDRPGLRVPDKHRARGNLRSLEDRRDQRRERAQGRRTASVATTCRQGVPCMCGSAASG